MPPPLADLVAEAADPATMPDRLAMLLNAPPAFEVALAALRNPNVPLDSALAYLKRASDDPLLSSDKIARLAEALVKNEALPFAYLTDKPFAMSVFLATRVLPLKHCLVNVTLEEDSQATMDNDDTWAPLATWLMQSAAMPRDKAAKLRDAIREGVRGMMMLDAMAGTTTRGKDIYDVLEEVFEEWEASGSLSPEQREKAMTETLLWLASMLQIKIPSGVPSTFNPFESI